MKRFSLFCVLALALCAVAMANITPTNTTTILNAGQWTWTYDFQLSNDQNVNQGTAPTMNPVPHTNLTFAGFLTIYDFAGYVNGSCAGPTGWTCTAQNVGFTPDDVVPQDNQNITNITWAYTVAGSPTIMGQPMGVDLGFFSAKSIFGNPVQVSYTSRGVKNIGPQTGTIADNVGNTQGPLGTPEPATVVSLGVGLALLGLIRRKIRST